MRNESSRAVWIAYLVWFLTNTNNNNKDAPTRKKGGAVEPVAFMHACTQGGDGLCTSSFLCFPLLLFLHLSPKRYEALIVQSAIVEQFFVY